MSIQSHKSDSFNILRPTQNARRFRRYLQMHFLEWKCLIFDRISLKYFLKGPINNNPAFFLDNGFMPARRRAIVCTNDG